MKLERVLKIQAPVNKVWKALLDVPYLVSCMPGVEDVEETAKNTYRCMVNARVSYISTTFDMTVNISKLIENKLLETVAEGKARMGLGRINQKQCVTLKPLSEKETEAVYQSEITLTGALSTFGQKAISAKFDEMADNFTRSFVSRFERTRKR